MVSSKTAVSNLTILVSCYLILEWWRSVELGTVPYFLSEILLLYPPVLVRGSKMVRSDWTLPANQVAVVSIRLYLKLWVVFFKR